jgi:hypothetical protein
MAGRGPAPKDPATRRRRNPPAREWKPTPGSGWQHGKIPPTPEGLMPASVTAWETWFKAWFAAHWTPDLLPGLRQVIRLYDEVERGEFQRSAELRLSLDTYGITPKGQQDRRWERPSADPAPAAPAPGPEPTTGRKESAMKLLRGGQAS